MVEAEEPEREDPELTPEQRDALRRSMDNVRRSLSPKINFNLPTFKLSKSTLKSISVASNFAAKHSKLFDSLKPVLVAQDDRRKQFGLINSDVFKMHAANQAQFAKLSAQLTESLDFGFGESLSKITQQFAAQQASWLKTLGPTLEKLKTSFYPPNLGVIEGLYLEDVEKVVMLDGIALYGVPRTAIAEALIRANSAAKRGEILGRRWKAISADCRVAVLACRSDAVASDAPVAVAALDALEGGHTAAAQALVGSLIDSLLTAYLGKDRANFTPNRKGTRTTSAYEEFTVREFIALAPTWQAYQQFCVEDGDRVPATFSRNATAHTVSSRQFNRRNAVQGLLFACSLLYFFNEQAVARAA
ncbi:MAG: hypothetical protein QOF51_3449 [Chloroflexota bacterium]|nr:hypothetical protein [Chloroflexota bacterium]